MISRMDMRATSKTSTSKAGRVRRVKVSVKRVHREQSEAARVEAYLKREGFKPLSAKEEKRLKGLGLLGMPSE